MKTLLTFFLIAGSFLLAQAKPKNVVIIVADDLGFNDVSFRGSNEIPTPNIDALAYGGVVLDRFYAAPMCTPSRSALMTGKYPISNGMQHFVIPNDEPWGLPLTDKIMPEYFKDAGFSTHLIGKWHLGFYKKEYTPTYRGYDTFFGYHGSHIDYWDHTQFIVPKNYSRGYDIRRNEDIEWPKEKIYATDMFTKEAVTLIEGFDKRKPFFMIVNHLAPHAGNEDFPMQAKEEDLKLFGYIENPKRRQLAAMVKSLDDSVGEIVESLRKSGHLQDTIIVFYSDNGGPTRGLHSTLASNFPLKGQKMSGWEGAIRTDAIIYAPSLPSGEIRGRYFYIGDFLPTLLSLSNAKAKIETPIDGIDLSRMLLNDKPPFRNEIVQIDNYFVYSSFIRDNYKLVNSSASGGVDDVWLGSNNNTNVNAATYVGRVLASKVARALRWKLSARKIFELRGRLTVKCSGVANACDLLKGPCLFDVIRDPCERNNLAATKPAVLESIKKRFDELVRSAKPTLRKPLDLNCDPRFFNYTWSNWGDYPPILE